MNKWLERAILLNIIMILLFFIADYLAWNGIEGSFTSIPLMSGTFDNVHLSSPYNILTRTIQFNANYRTANSFQSFAETNTTINITLFLFLATIALNLILIWKMTKENHEQ